MRRPEGERLKGKSVSFLEQAGSRGFDPPRLTLAFAGAVYVTKVFPGLFGEGKQAFDYLGLFVSKIRVFVDVMNQVEQFELSLAFRFSPVFLF